MKTSKPRRTDWKAVTPEQWSEGCAAVAATYGVTRQAAAAAHARLLNPKPRTGIIGRPPKTAKHLDRTQSVATLAEQHNVSTGTIYTWLAAQRD